MLRKRSLCLLALGAALWIPYAESQEFLAGADMSHLVFFEERGVVYKENGQPRDALETLKENGLNCVRLRLFTSSAQQAQSDPYNSINNLEYNIPLAARAKAAGLRVMLDFHYSDSWADPGKQTKPLDWQRLTFEELEQTMFEYNRNVIAAFSEAGALPDYVQVGNEIIGGMLWPDGRVGGNYDTPEQWSRLGRLVRAAIAGIKEAAGENTPEIIIHIDRGGDWGATRWFFDNLQNQRVSFDIIGESYYAWWHGDLDDLRTTLMNTAQRYRKPIIIAETAFPWSGPSDGPIVGIAPGESGQVDYVTELAEIMNDVPDGLGKGIVWWGTEYVRLPGVALAGFDRRSFFDFEGNALPVVKAFGQLSDAPRIGIDQTDQGFRLSWPLSGAGLELHFAPNITHPASDWSPVAAPVQNGANGFETFVDRLDQETGYYRLQAEP